MARDAVGILDRAVALAKAAGRTCSGWTMQSSEDGYVAWLYREDDEGQWPLFEGVEVRDTAQGAAEACLARATDPDEDGADAPDDEVDEDEDDDDGEE
jgi:hypothetical protein